jgi:penicillin-binding protein 1C
VLDILADPVARTPGFGLQSPLDFPFPVAAKTGTSRHFTDNWAVAATGRFTVAVWAGNFNGRPMDGVSGVSGAGPLLHRAVLATARRYPPGALTTPEAAGAVPVRICRLSGLRATDVCPGTVEWFAPGSEPTKACDWHRDGTVVLPSRYAEWVEQRGTAALEAKPPRDPARDASADAAEFRILSPQDGDVYRIPPGVERRFATVSLRAAGGAATSRLRWFVDDHPYSGRRWPLVPGTHRIRAMSPTGQAVQATVRVE